MPSYVWTPSTKSFNCKSNQDQDQTTIRYGMQAGSEELISRVMDVLLENTRKFYKPVGIAESTC